MTNRAVGLAIVKTGEGVKVILRVIQSGGLIQNLFMTYALEGLWAQIRD
jgi:hypothetical protein